MKDPIILGWKGYRLTCCTKDANASQDSDSGAQHRRDKKAQTSASVYGEGALPVSGEKGPGVEVLVRVGMP